MVGTRCVRDEGNRAPALPSVAVPITNPFRRHVFRRLFLDAFCRQVVDAQGKVTGLLDIAKCLYDAVHRLEKAAKKKAEEEEEGGGGGGGGNVAMLGAVMEAAKSIKGKATARNQQALQVSRTWEEERGKEEELPTYWPVFWIFWGVCVERGVCRG